MSSNSGTGPRRVVPADPAEVDLPMPLLRGVGLLALAGVFGVTALDPAAGVVLLVVFAGMYGVLRLVARLAR